MDSFIELLPVADRVLAQAIVDVARLKGWTKIGLWPEFESNSVLIDDLFGINPDGVCAFINKNIIIAEKGQTDDNKQTIS